MPVAAGWCHKTRQWMFVLLFQPWFQYSYTTFVVRGKTGWKTSTESTAKQCFSPGLSYSLTTLYDDSVNAVVTAGRASLTWPKTY